MSIEAARVLPRARARAAQAGNRVAREWVLSSARSKPGRLHRWANENKRKWHHEVSSLDTPALERAQPWKVFEEKAKPWRETWCPPGAEEGVARLTELIRVATADLDEADDFPPCRPGGAGCWLEVASCRDRSGGRDPGAQGVAQDAWGRQARLGGHLQPSRGDGDVALAGPSCAGASGAPAWAAQGQSHRMLGHAGEAAWQVEEDLPRQVVGREGWVLGRGSQGEQCPPSCTQEGPR